MTTKDQLFFTKNPLFFEMVRAWPSAIVARTEIERFTGGAITAKYITNLDALGKGPARIRIGRKVCYPVADLVKWLEARTSVVAGKGDQ